MFSLIKCLFLPFRLQPLRGLPEQINEQVTFGLRKDSELTPIFNLAVQEMKQSGVLQRIEAEWW